MKIVNYTYARKNLRKVLDQVIDDCESTCITSKSGQVVVMSKSDYDSIIETIYVTKSLEVQ